MILYLGNDDIGGCHKEHADIKLNKLRSSLLVVLSSLQGLRLCAALNAWDRQNKHFPEWHKVLKVTERLGAFVFMLMLVVDDLAVDEDGVFVEDTKGLAQGRRSTEAKALAPLQRVSLLLSARDNTGVNLDQGFKPRLLAYFQRLIIPR
eukprot:6467987-Amphidinium_carterae.1